MLVSCVIFIIVFVCFNSWVIYKLYDQDDYIRRVHLQLNKLIRFTNDMDMRKQNK